MRHVFDASTRAYPAQAHEWSLQPGHHLKRVVSRSEGASCSSRRRKGAHHVAGASLIEFALALPLLVFLVIGGMSLFTRNLYRSSLDEAADQAAWAAARTGGDAAAIQTAIKRSIPFVPLTELIVSATSSGYHAEVSVTISYRGSSIQSLPFFNEPLADAQASATNQQERAFDVRLGGVLPARAAPALAPPASEQPTPRSPLGPAVWPVGPAAQPGGA